MVKLTYFFMFFYFFTIPGKIFTKKLPIRAKPRLNIVHHIFKQLLSSTLNQQFFQNFQLCPSLLLPSLFPVLPPHFFFQQKLLKIIIIKIINPLHRHLPKLSKQKLLNIRPVPPVLVLLLEPLKFRLTKIIFTIQVKTQILFQISYIFENKKTIRRVSVPEAKKNPLISHLYRTLHWTVTLHKKMRVLN